MKFKDSQFMTAVDKDKVYRHWLAFVRTLARGEASERLFTKDLYNHLIQHCSFIAHYDRDGFFETYFSDPKDVCRFISQFDKERGAVSIEYGGGWVELEGHGDINNSMVEAATPLAPAIYECFKIAEREKDIEAARILLGKYGLRVAGE